MIQATEYDEFVYQEMMTHVPLFSHKCPKTILIVGGGDGGVLREVCKHACVEKIILVEIDPAVIEVSRQYFGETLATAFEDPRLTIVEADASKWLENVDADMFDVIITDAIDPVGLAESLFQPEFFDLIYATLKPGGVLCAQGASIWDDLNLITNVITACEQIFQSAQYFQTTVPSTTCGQIGFVICTKDRGGCNFPGRDVRKSGVLEQCRFYNENIHTAAFILPTFAKKQIGRGNPKFNDIDNTARGKVYQEPEPFITLSSARNPNDGDDGDDDGSYTDGNNVIKKEEEASCILS
jgi:spermidine synthase